MEIVLREGTPADISVLGGIAFEGFKSISSQHNFPWDLPSPEVATGMVSLLLSTRGFYCVVAEADGRPVGSNFLDLRNPVAGIGPITVDPAFQDQSIGRRLMEDVLARAARDGFRDIRLVQAAYHNRSLALYTKLGFATRESLSKVNGPPPRIEFPGYAIRQAALSDLPRLNELCRKVHGHDRGGEVADAIAQGTARVVEHLGRVTGYATDIAIFGHAVGETDTEIKALIGAAGEIGGGGFLVPTRNGDLLRWCFAQGLRLVHQMSLMTIGLYSEPAGAYLPSVTY